MVLGNKSPYQVLFNKAPDYDLLRVCGPICYVTVVPQPLDKFAPRSIKGVFLGYPYAKKGYKVLNLESKHVTVSRDVHFIENEFPFKNITVSDPSVLFPSNSEYVHDDPLMFESHSPALSHFPEHSISDHAFSDQPETQSECISSPHSDAITIPANNVPYNRPTRSKRVPLKYADYTGLPSQLAQFAGLSGQTNSTDCNTPSTSQSTHVQAPSVTSIKEPHTFSQAVKFPEWCTSMGVELAALEANNTWEIVSLPANKKTVGCRWLYRVKYHSNGQIDRFKARLVAKGFTQTMNMDYFETFAPVAKMTSFRLLLALAAMHNWTIKQLDITNAFLHGSLDEEVYMACSPGYQIPLHILKQYPNQKLVCRLLKSLYGLKQAPRQWCIALSSALLSFGFKQTVGDPSLFVFASNTSLIC